MASITLSAAELLLHRLQALDVAYIFINSGTDYPPVIEAWAKARATGQKVPELVICPHENAAIGMAHGYYLGTGKVQAVMVHTNVGLANAACGVINLANSNIPVLIFGGRTPISEHSHFGCRNTPIGYGQEMRDQAALIRESVKWDFELRLADQIGEHVDRAWAIASSLPKGPVYLSLPREPLCETFAIDEAALQAGPSQQPVRYAPVREDIARAAEAIACARHPVIFAQRGARTAGGFARLNSLVREWAIPLVEYWGTEVTLSADNPLLAGADPSAWLADADVILVVDSQAPWMLAEGDCRQDCTVIQMGPDPLFSRYPYVAIARTSTWRAKPMKSSACWKRRCARCRPPASNMWRSGRHIRSTASSNRKTSATRFSMPARPGSLPNPGSATASAIWRINTAAGSFLS